MSTPPAELAIYHIIHLDRLRSILNDGFIYSDATIRARPNGGTQIGFSSIKERRAVKQLDSYPDLCVGDCVPFYFCPRSVMLFVIHKGNHDGLPYRGGQDQILHLRFDMHSCISWADKNNFRWVFTNSNAGNHYFDDFNDIAQLSKINWDAVSATDWKHSSIKEEKQAEFLVENRLDFSNVAEIGVYNVNVLGQVRNMIIAANRNNSVSIQKNWYY